MRPRLSAQLPGHRRKTPRTPLSSVDDRNLSDGAARCAGHPATGLAPNAGSTQSDGDAGIVPLEGLGQPVAARRENRSRNEDSHRVRPRTQRCQPPQGYRAVPARPRGRAQSVRRRNPPAIRLGIGPGDRTHRRRHPEVPSMEGTEPHLPLHGQTDRPVRLHGRFRAFRYRAYRPPSEGRRQLADEQDPLREPLQPRTQARQASVGAPESRRRHGKNRRTRVVEGNRQLAKTDRNAEAQEQKRYDQIGKGRSHTAPPRPANAARLLARQVRAFHDDGSSRRVQQPAGSRYRHDRQVRDSI